MLKQDCKESRMNNQHIFVDSKFHTVYLRVVCIPHKNKPAVTQVIKNF